MWSLGCILAELFTGYVLFQNDSVQGLLNRVMGTEGPVPEYMMKESRRVSKFFMRGGLIYQEAGAAEDQSDSCKGKEAPSNDDGLVKMNISLKHYTYTL